MLVQIVASGDATSHTADIDALITGLKTKSLAEVEELCQVQQAEEVHGIGVATDAVLAAYTGILEATVTTRRATLDGLRV